ncbi:conjugal transfer protein TraB, partial [Streptomyces prunicolor]
MSTDLVPADGGNLPAVNGDSAGFIQLSASVLILSARALLLKEGLNHLQREMEENATKTREFAEKCAQAEVDEQFVSLLMEAAAALQEVADATGDLS